MSPLLAKPLDPPRQLGLLLSMALACFLCLYLSPDIWALARRGEPISHQRSFPEGAMRHSRVGAGGNLCPALFMPVWSWGVSEGMHVHI